MGEAEEAEAEQVGGSEADLGALAEAFRVLGSERRLRLLQFLVEPHYLEEIASEFKMARQTAQDHVQQLVELGMVRRLGPRRGKPGVVDYVVVPQRLFRLHIAVGQLGGLQPELDAADPLRAPTTPLASAPAAPAEQDLPRLVVVNGLRVGRTVALGGSGPWLVGRDPTAPVCLDYDPFISLRHAEVRRAAGGGFEVADLYSSNGTWLDWRRLPRGGAQPLPNGAAVRVGKSVLLFRRPV